jgi:phosphatidylinositol 4-phosphatase
MFQIDPYSRYFHDNLMSIAPAQLQSGVVRTNCMDNLDRTNVVQSALAKWILTQQFRAAAVLQKSEDVDHFEEFMKIFRNSMLTWALFGQG